MFAVDFSFSDKITTKNTFLQNITFLAFQWFLKYLYFPPLWYKNTSDKDIFYVNNIDKYN